MKEPSQRQERMEKYRMGIGKRIRYFRNKQGLTMLELGKAAGFSERTANVRVAQYESESRRPKDDLIDVFASIFNVSAQAITVPDIESNVGLMYTLFALEDQYGLRIEEVNGIVCMRIDPQMNWKTAKLNHMLEEWCKKRKAYQDGQMSKDEYDQWRYHYK